MKLSNVTKLLVLMLTLAMIGCGDDSKKLDENPPPGDSSTENPPKTETPGEEEPTKNPPKKGPLKEIAIAGKWLDSKSNLQNIGNLNVGDYKVDSFDQDKKYAVIKGGPNNKFYRYDWKFEGDKKQEVFVCKSAEFDSADKAKEAERANDEAPESKGCNGAAWQKLVRSIDIAGQWISIKGEITADISSFSINTGFRVETIESYDNVDMFFYTQRDPKKDEFTRTDWILDGLDLYMCLSQPGTKDGISIEQLNRDDMDKGCYGGAWFKFDRTFLPTIGNEWKNSQDQDVTVKLNEFNGKKIVSIDQDPQVGNLKVILEDNGKYSQVLFIVTNWASVKYCELNSDQKDVLHAQYEGFTFDNVNEAEATGCKGGAWKELKQDFDFSGQWENVANISGTYDKEWVGGKLFSYSTFNDNLKEVVFSATSYADYTEAYYKAVAFKAPDAIYYCLVKNGNEVSFNYEHEARVAKFPAGSEPNPSNMRSGCMGSPWRTFAAVTNPWSGTYWDENWTRLVVTADRLLEYSPNLQGADTPKLDAQLITEGNNKDLYMDQSVNQAGPFQAFRFTQFDEEYFYCSTGSLKQQAEFDALIAGGFADTKDKDTGCVGKAWQKLSVLPYIGEWADQYGDYTFTKQSWMGSRIVAYTEHQGLGVVYSYAADLNGNKKYSRNIVHTDGDDTLYYCTDVYGQDSLHDATQPALNADVNDLGGKGCGNQFPWSKLTRKK